MTFSSALTYLISRTGIVIGVLALLLGALTRDSVVDRAVMVRKLNASMPSRYGSLIDPESGVSEASVLSRKKYVSYYENVLTYFPEDADAQGLLGYALLLDDEKQRGLRLMEEAARAAPGFFWFQYNLAVLEADTGHTGKAIERLRRALAFPPETSLKVYQSSRLYHQIMVQENLDGAKLNERLRKGYLHAAVLLSELLLEEQRYQDMIEWSPNIPRTSGDQSGVIDYYRGVALLKTNHFLPAVQSFQAALGKGWETAELFVLLADCLRRVNKETLAVQALERARLLRSRGRTHTSLKPKHRFLII